MHPNYVIDDKMDNITAKVTEHGDYDYGYDDLYRLTGADNPVQADEGFSYDAVGNRLTAAGVADNWSYNDNNELQGYGGISLEYDDNGNMTRKTEAGQVTNYIYNVEDRLEKVEDGSGSLISLYYYDPFGRRLWKEVNGVRTYFVYADEGLVAEVDSAGNVVKSYGYRPGSTWTTDPLFMKVGGQYYLYQNDHLGTPQKLIAVNGAVVWSAKYSSFGEADVDALSTVTNNLRFAGQYYDGESGLHYNRFRYYAPQIGRYTRTDPIGLTGGINLFVYTGSNPSNAVDPKGLDYVLTVYVDQPSNRVNDTVVGVSSLGKVDTGHTWIGLEDTEARKVTIRGFYPSDDERPNPFSNAVVKGTVKNDIDRFYDVRREYILTKEQYEAALEKLKEYEKKPPNFDVNAYNCTDWAEEMSKAAGQQIPDTYSEWPGGGGSNPYDLGEALRKLNDNK